MAILTMASNLARAGEKYSSEEITEQIREIAELMSLGQWVLSVTENEMARKWSVTVSSVRSRAAEARRLVQHAYGDTEDLRSRVLAQLEGIAGETRRKEPRTAVSALLGVAAVAGLIVTQRHDTREQKPNSKLSPAERRVEIARIRAQLDEADAIAIAELSTIDVPLLDPGTPDEST